MRKQRSDQHNPVDASGKKPPQSASDAPAGAPGGLRAMLFETAGQLAAAPLIGLIAGFFLLFGGVFLAIAWSTGPQPLIDSFQYAPFTAQASGRIVESWAAIEFDPNDVPQGKLYWQPVSKVSPCVVVEYTGDWGAPLRRAFCGNRFQFREDFRLDDWNTMAPGVPFAFPRDASGFSVEEIRISKTTLDWISTHPPRSTFMLSKPPPTTALGALKEQFDRPLDVALASWSTPFPTFPLAYDPKHPDQAMPAKLVDERRRGFWWGSLIFTVILAVPGVLVWRIGLGFLTGQSGAILWLLTLAPMLALPWWSDVLPGIVRRANSNWAEIVSDMLDDINRVTRFSASTSDQAVLAHGERLVWHVESGAYGDTFGKIRFTLPQPPPASEAAALEALRAQASTQVLALDADRQKALFERLRQQYEADAQDVQRLFWKAAEDVLRDAHGDRGAHLAARRFLIFGSGGTYYEDQLDKLEQAASR
ncbi:MAG TPA: hypothetical protein VLB69_09365 [Rudaea sp.]|nr:hypothetical protein [Rudaea sp.]